jgi:hypothetical protein
MGRAGDGGGTWIMHGSSIGLDVGSEYREGSIHALNKGIPRLREEGLCVCKEGRGGGGGGGARGAL